MSGMVLVFARSVASGRDNETHAGSNMMKSKFSQSIGTGSLGETRRPRTLEELDRYTIERSIQGSSRPTILIAEDDAHAGLDGLKVTHDLRLNDKTREMPIVIVSGWDPSEREHAAFAAGGNEYLLKPIDFDQVESILNRYLPLHSTAGWPTSAS